MIMVGVGVLFYVWRRSHSGGGTGFSSFSSSATPTLDSYAIDFTQMAREGKIYPVVGRAEEVRRATQVLSRRTKNNVILVGAPGVGKTAIVEGLAQRIVKGEVPDVLIGKRVLALQVASLLAGTKYRGEFEERAKKLVQEIETSARQIILFIDEIHTVIQSRGAEGAVNFADILKPALAHGDLQLIGATTTNEYSQYIKTDESLERRFQLIEVEEPSSEQAIVILQGVKDKYREYHNVEFTDGALEAAVRLTDKYIKGRHLPDKAIDAIDEAAAMVKVSHLHTGVVGALQAAAARKDPSRAELWVKVQALDKKIFELPRTKRAGVVAEREQLETGLAKLGTTVVDVDDVIKIIEDWTGVRVV